MTVLMTLRVKADEEQFRRFTREHADVLDEVGEYARSQGCIHHRFGVGDGFVTVVDEWESPDHFHRFFDGNDKVAEVMRRSGAQGEPEITFSEAIATSDQF